MDRIALKADERTVLGKNVKKYRKQGLIPGNVYGKGFESEAVFVSRVNFHKAYGEAGLTGLIDLKIGDDKTKPVLIRELQFSPVKGELQHINFYQVNLNVKVTVMVPIVLVGEEAELVHLGEAVVLNPVSQVEVEALPNDLIDKIEVDITPLKAIDDAVTVGQLILDREKVTVLTPEEEVVVKLAPAITEEMQKLMEEQAAEAAAAVEATEAVEGDEGEKVEGASPSAEATGDREVAEGEVAEVAGESEEESEPSADAEKAETKE